MSWWESASPRIHVDVGDASARDPVPTGVWDSAKWDAADALWSGTLPNFVEVTCRVLSVRTQVGRMGPLDTFTPGTATIVVANDDGWATWAPTSPTPVTAGSWVRVRADTTTLWTGTVRKIEDDYTPGRPLTATIVAVDTLAALGTAELVSTTPTGAGETAPARVGRLLDLVGWPGALRRFDADPTPLAAVVVDGNLLDLAQQATFSVLGALFADRDGALVWRNADWLRTAARSATAQALVVSDPADPPAPPPAYPTNIVTADQASVETSLGTWARSGAGTAVPTRVAGGRDGSWSVQSSSANGAAFTPQLIPQGTVAANRTPVAANTTYTVWASLWHDTAWASTPRARVFFQDAAGANVGTSTVNWSGAARGMWTDLRALVTSPATAVTSTTTLEFSGTAVIGEPVRWDRYGMAAGDWSTAQWVPPGYTPTPPVPWTPQICPIAMAPNGPDVDRVVNLATATGANAATDPPATATVTAADADSRARYRDQTFNVSDLQTVDPAVLGKVTAAVLAQRKDPRPRLDSLAISPLADPRARDYVIAAQLGDRLVVTYTHPTAGWSWTFQVHVHGVAHDITPAGVDQRAGAWTMDLTVADATYYAAAAGWDLSVWDTAVWAAAALTEARQADAGPPSAAPGPAPGPTDPGQLRHSDEMEGVGCL